MKTVTAVKLSLLILLFVGCKTAAPDSAEILDKGMNSSGKPVFIWPTDSNHRNYDRLAELMNQYSELTGNCLNRPAEGSGEAAFKTELESRRRVVKQAFMTGGLAKGCLAFRQNFIDQNYVGSAFAQYGYCNESSYTALCLATQAGFKNTEILKCDTMHYTNDHTFTMVERPGQKWCMMDRYDLINKGHFFCNASWNEPTKLIFVGSSAANHRWYEGIACKTLDRWLAGLK